MMKIYSSSILGQLLTLRYGHFSARPQRKFFNFVRFMREALLQEFPFTQMSQAYRG